MVAELVAVGGVSALEKAAVEVGVAEAADLVLEAVGREDVVEVLEPALEDKL